MYEEIPLSGGNLSTVVRVGDTVRRTLGPWSPAIHSLLRHLEARGFTGAPRFLGIDEQGREVLSFLPGDTGFVPYMWTDAALTEAARLLRRFHDATAGYLLPPEAVWQFVYPDPSRHEIICHNDFAPYNLVFAEGKPCAMIDFDLAGPGPRIWDVAFTVYWFVPLSYSGDPGVHGLADLMDGSRRLHRFCAAYGVEASLELVDTVEQRLQALCAYIVERAAAGDSTGQKLRDEGHLAYWQEETRLFRQHRPRLEQNRTGSA